MQHRFYPASSLLPSFLNVRCFAHHCLSDYLERSINARHAANNKANTIKKAAKGQQQLDAAGTANDIPALATYPTLDTAVTLHGLKALSCPA